MALAFGLQAQSFAGQFLEVNPDARSLSLANSAVVMDASSFSVWNNAAASVFSENRFSAAASYGMWQPSVANAQLASAAGYGRIGEKLSVSAGFKYFMHKSYEISSSEGIYSGTFTPSEYLASVGVAYKFIPSLSASLGLNYIGSDLGGPKAASAFAANLGLLYVNGGFKAGLTASNIGTALNYGGSSSYSLPMRADLGLAYSFGSADASRLAISAQAGMRFADSAITAAAGLEYKFKKLLRFAAGYNLCTAPAASNFISLGAGFSFFGVSVDLAYLLGTSGSPVSNSLMINLAYAF